MAGFGISTRPATRTTWTKVEYASWQVSIAAAVAESSVPGASFFYNHKQRSRDSRTIHPLDITRQFFGWQLRQEIVWHRPGAVQFNARMFAPNDERIIWLVRNDRQPHKWNQDARSLAERLGDEPADRRGRPPVPVPA